MLLALMILRSNADGRTVTVMDSGDFHKNQYLWYYGEKGEKSRDLCDKLEQPNKDAQERTGMVKVMDRRLF